MRGHPSLWGPGLQPRHVPCLGIELATLWFAGWCSIHWTTPARAHLFFIPNEMLFVFRNKIRAMSVDWQNLHFIWITQDHLKCFFPNHFLFINQRMQWFFFIFIFYFWIIYIGKNNFYINFLFILLSLAIVYINETFLSKCIDWY